MLHRLPLKVKHVTISDISPPRPASATPHSGALNHQGNVWLTGHRGKILRSKVPLVPSQGNTEVSCCLTIQILSMSSCFLCWSHDSRLTSKHPPSTWRQEHSASVSLELLRRCLQPFLIKDLSFQIFLDVSQIQSLNNRLEICSRCDGWSSVKVTLRLLKCFITSKTGVLTPVTYFFSL